MLITAVLFFETQSMMLNAIC